MTENNILPKASYKGDWCRVGRMSRPGEDHLTLRNDREHDCDQLGGLVLRGSGHHTLYTGARHGGATIDVDDNAMLAMLEHIQMHFRDRGLVVQMVTPASTGKRDHLRLVKG
jgi:hypothetical protein